MPVTDNLKGFSVTFRHLFRKPVTQQFPDFKRPVYPRFRGRHRLHRHENGLEKCVGCSLCAAACPADCIRVVAAENTPEERYSAGERYARIYEINMSRCIFCGYCELACPFDAITLGHDYELAEMSRDALVYTKQMLLEPGPEARRTPVAPVDPYDIVFVVASALAIASALGVVLSVNPFYSALSLIMHLVSLATMYLLLQADFLAAAQVIVYAGAVMIMFLFVIAYLGNRADEPTRDIPLWQLGAAVVAGSAVVIEIVVAVASQAFGSGATVTDQFGNPSLVANSFFSRYLLGFEATSILLLVAAVGAVVLGSKRPSPRVDQPDDFPAPRPQPELELQAAVMGAETAFPVHHMPRKDEDGG